MRIGRISGALGAILLFAVGLSAQKEEFVFKGARLYGAFVGEDGADLLINLYHSTNTRMTYGVERRPKAALQKRIPDADPVRSYLMRRARIEAERGDDPAGDTELAKIAAAEKWPAVAEEHWLNALRKKSDHAEALAGIDPRALAIAKRADHRLNGALDRALREAMTIPAADLRKKEFERIVADYGWNGSLLEFERARRSAQKKKGRTDDVLLTLAAKTEHGIYTLHVPESYDPFVPIPLVVALHGGGPDGKDRKGVIGSGRSAMNFYDGGAEREKMIVVCPTAIEAPWSAAPNDPFVMAVVREIELLFNIDRNRVYLTGHSMGGFGTWFFGPKYASLWAAIAPMSGGGHRGLEQIEETLTGVYLYHGANDEVVSCGGSRAAAAEMQKRRMDFVYTEIPDSGHGFPADVNDEMWAFFRSHRLGVNEKGKWKTTLAVDSSFAQKVTDEERLYFGAPGEEIARDKKTMLARLRLGGGAAMDAADALVLLADKTSIPAIGAVLADEKAPFDQRRAAAHAISGIAAPEGAPFVLKALSSADPRVITIAAEASVKVFDKGTPKALAKAAAHAIEIFRADADAKGAMDYTDFEKNLRMTGALARAVAAVKDPGATAILASFTKDILLPAWQVEASDRAGVDPKRPLAAAVISVLDAIAATGDAKARPLIVDLKAKHGGLPGVDDAAERAAKAVLGS